MFNLSALSPILVLFPFIHCPSILIRDEWSKKSIRWNILKCSSKLNSEELLQYDNPNVSELKTDNTKCRVVKFEKASVAVELIPKEHSKRNLAAKKDASKPWFFTHVWEVKKWGYLQSIVRFAEGKLKKAKAPLGSESTLIQKHTLRHTPKK